MNKKNKRKLFLSVTILLLLIFGSILKQSIEKHNMISTENWTCLDWENESVVVENITIHTQINWRNATATPEQRLSEKIDENGYIKGGTYQYYYVFSNWGCELDNKYEDNVTLYDGVEYKQELRWQEFYSCKLLVSNTKPKQFCIQQGLNCRNETKPCILNYKPDECKVSCAYTAMINEAKKQNLT